MHYNLRVKRIAGLLVLFSGVAFAQAPSCTQVNGLFYTDSPSGPILMPTGSTVQLALNYTVASNGINIGNSMIRAEFSNGAINAPANYVCLTPGVWAATYTVAGVLPRPAPFNRTWTIPGAGGPYTRAQVESTTPPLQAILPPLPAAGGLYCLLVSLGPPYSAVWSTSCGTAPPTSLSYHSLTNAQYTAMTNSQYTGMTN